MEPTELVDETELPTAASGAIDTAADGALVEDELLVEEISIDGMCGVY